jgi:hypothetical protein
VSASKVFVTDNLADKDVECKVPDANKEKFQVKWTKPGACFL